MVRAKYIASGFLLISVVLFAFMVPGGPVETRHFGDYPVAVLAAFNIFLTALGIVSLLFATLTLKENRWGAAGSMIAGVCFALVYTLDLTKVFPISPDPMPPLLRKLEIAGLALSLPVLGSSLFLAFRTRPANGGTPRNGWARAYFPAIVMVFLLGLCVVVFATYHAMKK